MKPSPLLCTLVLSACASSAGFAPAGEHIGMPVEDRPAETLAAVHAAPEAHFDKTLLVEATVTAVCQTKGCWMQVEDQGVTSMVRWETGCGGKFAFPKDAVGERVLIQGSFYPKQIAEADLAHLQQEAGGKLDIPPRTYEMNASAVVLIERGDG